MRIYSEIYREECDVYGIAISLEARRPASERVTLYIKNSEMFGLGTEILSNVKIIDNKFGEEFKLHYFNHGDGVMILWDHFVDIDHLARLIDLDPETVATFEKALAARNSPP